MLVIRTCSQVCIDADNNNDDLLYLSNLWKEVVANKYHYPIVELQFIHEYLMDKVKEMAVRDAIFFKSLLHLED